MSSDPFLFLGLDRKTATDADVRRAYAERLKVTRPEDDRDAFMTLRAAFEQARREVVWREKFGGEGDVEEDWPASEEADGGDQSAGGEAVPHSGLNATLTDAFLTRLSAIMATGASPAESVRTLLTSDGFGDIDTLARLGQEIRAQICEETGLFARWTAAGSQHPALVHWMQLWPFETLRPAKDWPDWLRLDVLDALNAEFQWTEELSFDHWVRLQDQWLLQVSSELIWAELPKEAAVFNRFAAAIRDPYRWPDEPALMTLLKAGSAESETARCGLSAMIRDLILSETLFGKRLVVARCPRWLTSSLYDQLDAWFGWSAASQKQRGAINREKARLRDMSKSRPKGTPLDVREAAWLEMVREEAVWVRLPAKTRLLKSRDQYYVAREAEQRTAWLIIAVLLLLGLPVAGWLFSLVASGG